MLVKELRDLLKQYKEEELRLLIVEMYKSMPKKLKEEKGIDALIQNPRSPKRKGKQQEPVDVESLMWDAEKFVDYAYNQYYFAPNSYVHKKERPKWRFKARSLINDLLLMIQRPHTRDFSRELGRFFRAICSIFPVENIEHMLQ